MTPEARKLYMREYYAKNSERIIAYNKQWRETHDYVRTPPKKTELFINNQREASKRYYETHKKAVLDRI